MNQIKRAIIMAAGMGKRMNPVTLRIPKPLVSINGVCMIDSVIQALHWNGIKEIYIVVGYLKEQFERVKDQYCGVQLLDNPYYSTCNNISSLYIARNYLENAMILDGDQMIYNPNILSPYFERSCYNVVWTDTLTREWLLDVKDNRIVSCSREGGKKGWQLYSISRWSKEDGKKLRKHLEIEFEQKGNRQLYWDDLALFCYPQIYNLGVFQMKSTDLKEIDTLEELIAIDHSYIHFLTSKSENLEDKRNEEK